MKILFIVPTIPQLRPKKNYQPIGSKIFRVPFSGILVAASCLPERHNITIIDEHIELINFDFDCDLVGITISTPVAKHAYEIAAEFRKRGKTVFVGGFHPTFNPKEVLQYVDSVIIGEAENNITSLVEDAEHGQIKQIYYLDQLCDLKDSPMIRKELIRSPNYYFTTNVIQATRGCVYRCNFCGVRQFYRDTYRKRPIESVIEEIRRTKEKKVLFTDDNLIGDIAYAKELFKRLIPLKRWWMGQMSINCVSDQELLKLAARSGCLGIFIGFETLNKQTIGHINKQQNIISNYKEVIATMHKFGISVAAGTMFGFDVDTKNIFRETVDYFLDAKLDVIQVDPVTGFPGTPLYEKLQTERRIITNDWNKFNIAEATFQPALMTTDELDAGVRYVRTQFYTIKNIIIRFFRVLRYRGFAAAFVIGYFNWGYWRHLKQRIGYPP